MKSLKDMKVYFMLGYIFDAVGTSQSQEGKRGSKGQARGEEEERA